LFHIGTIHREVEVLTDGKVRSVDSERVLMYWQIGKVIFEEEQQRKLSRPKIRSQKK
jgi:hypothetical protein